MNCLALGLMTAVLLGREAIAQPIERVNLDTDCGPVRVAIENLNGTETYQASFHRTFPDIPPGVDEYIVSGSARYSRSRNGPWVLTQRKAIPIVVDGFALITKCRLLRSDTVDGIESTVYSYRHMDRSGNPIADSD